MDEPKKMLVNGNWVWVYDEETIARDDERESDEHYRKSKEHSDYVDSELNKLKRDW